MQEDSVPTKKLMYVSDHAVHVHCFAVWILESHDQNHWYRCCGSRSFEDARYWCWWALDCLWQRQTFQVSGNTTFLLSLEHRKPRLFECCMTVQVATPFPSFLGKVQHGIPIGSCSVFPAVNNVLADLPSVPESIPDDYMPLIEKFVAVLYSSTSAT